MDEVAQMLVAQLAAGDEDMPPTSIPELVEQSLGDDPLAAPLAAMLRQREARAAAESDRDADPLEDPEVAALLERLYAENEALRDLTRMLADALGACARCFGEDELCPVCRGRGRPGGREPDVGLFTQLVEPAWQRIAPYLSEQFGTPDAEAPVPQPELQAP
jgi:hypothetical protein